MQAGRQGGSASHPLNPVGYSFITQGEWGWEKDLLFLSGSSSSSLVSGKVCIPISRRAVLKLLPLV